MVRLSNQTKDEVDMAVICRSPRRNKVGVHFWVKTLARVHESNVTLELCADGLLFGGVRPGLAGSVPDTDWITYRSESVESVVEDDAVPDESLIEVVIISGRQKR